MDASFHLFDSIVILGIMQGLLYTALLLIKYGQYPSKRLLALTLFVFCILSAKILLHTLGLWQKPAIRYFPLAFDLTLQPLLYLYAVSLTQKQFQFKRIYFLHFVPTLVFLVHAIVVYIQTQATDNLALKDQIAEGLAFNIVKQVEDFLSVMMGGVYGFMSLHRLTIYRKWLFATISSTSYPTYTWLRNVLLVTGGVWILLTLNILLDVSFSYSFPYFLHWQFFYLYLVVSVYYLAIMGYQQPPFEVAFDESKADTSLKQKPVGLTQAQIEDVRNKLDIMLEQERVFLDPDLHLNALAGRLQLSPGLVSAVINSEYNMSFRSLINERRVDEVKLRLADPAYSHLSILGIALESGFNSEASFYRVFKSSTGVSPKQYSAQKAIKTVNENSQKPN